MMKPSVALVLALLALAACSTPRIAVPDAAAPEGVVGDTAALAEVTRISLIPYERNLTLDDLVRLKAMLAPDAEAASRIEEAETLIGIGEPVHAAHALGYLSDYVRTGRGLLCPAHELEHYLIFREHGLADLAEESLAEARGQYPSWRDRLLADASAYQGIDIPLVVRRVGQDIDGAAALDAGELRFLGTDADICVDEG